MISIGFGNSERMLVARLNGRAPTIIRSVATRLTRLMLLLQRHIVRDKLSGQVLHRRSGKLAQSIVAYPTEASGTELQGRVEGASGPAWYGRVHEFGGTHEYEIHPVNGRALAFFAEGYSAVPGGRQIMRGMSQNTNLNRKVKAIASFNAQGGVVVAAVLHHPPALRRPFMLPSALEMRPQILTELKEAANDGLKGE